ncbi:type II secretion system F family protein [Noviherbaspirillum galbum]|uniref:Type II secretion system F family protein n=1 Tax=Noviherbaspirillum galbum TaxID=2709383 RepID=A0A6B3SJZ3_9BURK|nr:type II secretion system F family protein [Noviherbaspirillum galbum]NEX61050.1 type II secretion system F family protein [Noviherbaspirillum galbum]
MIILAILIFLSVTTALLAVYLLISPDRVQQRLDALGGKEERLEWRPALVGLVGPFARLSAPAGDWDTSPLRVKFINAGFRQFDARFIFFGVKTLLPLLFSGLAFLALRATTQMDGLTLTMFLMAAALFGCYLPNMVLHLKSKSRKREIFDNFPDAADLMLVCVEAGLGLDAALTRVAEEMKIKCLPLAEELQLTNLEIRAGGAREQALRNLSLRTGVDEVSVFATMLTQADRFGTSIGESLRVFSDDLRHKRQMRAEELAAKVPTKMLFPLVVFVFPSIVMVVLGPAVIQVIRTVVPMLTNGL